MPEHKATLRNIPGLSDTAVCAVDYKVKHLEKKLLNVFQNVWTLKQSMEIRRCLTVHEFTQFRSEKNSNFWKYL